MGGLAQGATELPCVETHIDGIVELRMAQEDEVVDGDDAGDATLADANRQLARQTVIELHTIMQEIADDIVTAPQRRQMGGEHGVGIAESDVGTLEYLIAQMLATGIGGIEAELQGILGQIVDQRAAIGAQACAVANDALGIETDVKECVAHDKNAIIVGFS